MTLRGSFGDLHIQAQNSEFLLTNLDVFDPCPEQVPELWNLANFATILLLRI